MVILLFGPPGCGKGTQAAFLEQKLQIPAISTGEMFRAECKAGTELGKQACAILAKGGLVGDEIVNGMVANRIAQPDCANGFLLDGYPRTVEQAASLAALLEQRAFPQPTIIHLHVPDDALVVRLTARRQCPTCGHIYNLLSQPPQTDGKCDSDGDALVTREDDREEVIRRRLAAYSELTNPILEWYGESVVCKIDGSAAPEEVSRAIHEIIFDCAPTLASK